MIGEKIEDITETEFLEFVAGFFLGKYGVGEREEPIEKFIRLAEHPSGTDLLAYPNPARPDTPEGVVEEIKAWRAANGKPGFKKA